MLKESVHRLLLNSSHSTMDNDNASDFPLPPKVCSIKEIAASRFQIDHPPYDVNMSDVQPQDLAHNGTFTIGPGPRGWTSIDLLQLIRISRHVPSPFPILSLLQHRAYRVERVVVVDNPGSARDDQD